ncbi:unnamed protein product, partial [Scytosiphon promiscuus]
GTAARGAPAVTSYGLFHQQPEVASGGSNRSASTTEASGREPWSSSSSGIPRRHRRSVADVKAKNHAETFASAAPAFESAAAAGGDEGSGAVTNQHSNELLERHTSAAKDGVIELLTAKASKLGASLERSLLARKEIEDGAHKLQGLLDAETSKVKNLEHLVQQKQAETEASASENGHLKWEVDALRIELQDAEDRSKGCMQEEVQRRRTAEEALTREHTVASEYLEGVYQQEDMPKIGDDGRVTTAEILVRELRAIGEALREREGELEGCAERLDEAVCDVKAERTRQARETIQEQLVFTQERFEVAKRKVRQLSGRLEVEVGDNEALRARLHAMEEDNDIRVKSLQERKAKAQHRKRGDTRDMMAESKAKDDRIKALESSLMQERARLEGELQTARSDYEEAAKESRRKAARLQKRCLELEYRVATQSNRSETNAGGRNVASAASTSSSAPTNGSRSNFGTTGGGRISLRAEGRASSGETRGSGGRGGEDNNSVDVTTGSGLAATAIDAKKAGTAAGRRHGRLEAQERKTQQQPGRVGDGGGISSRSDAAGVAPAKPPPAQSAFAAAKRSQSSSSFPASADRLPDPSRHNEGAPAWMRSDLSVDRVRID